MFATIGILGAVSLGAGAVSLGAGLVERWARSKNQEEVIARKVDKAVDSKLKEYGIQIIEDDEDEEGEEADEG